MVRFEKRNDGQVEFFGEGFSKALNADLKVITNPHGEGGAILISAVDNPAFDRNAISFDFAEVDLAGSEPALSATNEAELIEELNTVFFNTVNAAATGGGGGLPYQVITGFIDGNGGGLDPDITVLENTSPYSIVGVNGNNGILALDFGYSGDFRKIYWAVTCPGPTAVASTYKLMPSGGGARALVKVVGTSGSSLDLGSNASETGVTSLIYFEIRIYP